jgi:tRNA A37 threonylcarbamoyltransferase TsaD
MDNIQLNPARLYSCDETAITVAQHKHTKILGFKCKRQISSFNRQNGDLL